MQDLTKGSPLRQILIFTVPVLIGNLFQELYNLVDTIIVGQLLGTDALAAVGVAGSVGWMVQGFCLGMTMGCSIYTSQHVGAQDWDGVRRSIAANGVIAAVLAVLLTGVFVPLARPMLHLMNTPDNVLDDAATYLSIFYGGLGATLLYNMLAAAMRALGDSRTPLYFLILSSILNIVGDLALILFFDMGVAGAALATVGAQLISGLACLAYIARRMPQMHIHRADLRVQPAFLWQHIRLGVPAGLQFTITSIGGVVLQTVLNGFGSNAVAGYTVYNRTNSLCMNPLITLATALSTFVGQNRGAHLYARIREGVRKTLLLNMGLAVVLACAILLLLDPVISLFVSNPPPEVVHYAKNALIWSMAFYFVLAALFVYRNSLQGLGDATSTMVGAGMELLVRIVVPVGLSGVIGFTSISIASPLAWIFCTVPLMAIYFWRMRKLERAQASTT